MKYPIKLPNKIAEPIIIKNCVSILKLFTALPVKCFNKIKKITTNVIVTCILLKDNHKRKIISSKSGPKITEIKKNFNPDAKLFILPL